MDKRQYVLIVTITVAIFLFISGITAMVFFSGREKPTISGTEADSNSEANITEVIHDIFNQDTDRPINFLMLVGDNWGGNTDTILLMNYNPENSYVNILSIPRDTRVSSNTKINALFAKKNGSKILLDTTSTMLNVNIKYYVYFNISTIKKIIDQLGGVVYPIPFDMDYDDPTQNLHIHLKKGTQVIDGNKAEQLLRFRKPNGDFSTWPKEVRQYCDGSDVFRIKTQQAFIMELLKQRINLKNLPAINGVIDTVFDHLKTNITLDEILNILSRLGRFDANKVFTHSMPGKSNLELVGSEHMSFFIIDKSASKKLANEYFKSSEDYQSIENVNNDKKPVIYDTNNQPKENPSNSETHTETQPNPLP